MDLLEKARQYESENYIPSGKRPAFHVTPPVGWMNDPNGFSEYQGKIHLFYQYHPYSVTWGPMHWGHQVTEDMVHWQECPVALAPDEDYDNEGCFSGSAIETDEGHVLLYTGVAKDESGTETVQNQCIAIGDGNIRLLQGICCRKDLAGQISGIPKFGEITANITWLQAAMIKAEMDRLSCLREGTYLIGNMTACWQTAADSLAVCGSARIFLNWMAGMS